MARRRSTRCGEGEGSFLSLSASISSPTGQPSSAPAGRVRLQSVMTRAASSALRASTARHTARVRVEWRGMADENEGADGTGDSALEALTSAVGGLVTGVPAPVRRNFFKAFGALCTAAVDIPVARLEGKAAELRAQTDARVKLISTNANQIAGQMHVPPEYAHAAVRKFGQKIVQQQINTDKVVEVAASVLQNEAESSGTASEASEVLISDDWLNNFQKEVEQVTSEEMRLLFGKVLAGEITQPSSYSIRTVRLLSQLDNQAAVGFRKFCSLCIALKSRDRILDARVATLNRNPGSNGLLEYGLPYGTLNILQEYGLVLTELDTNIGFQMCIANSENVARSGFIYQNALHVLVPSQERNSSTEFKLSGIALTQAGKELFRIVDPPYT